MTNPRTPKQKESESPFDRALPSDIESERIILGSILFHNETLEQIETLLKRDDFFLDSHRRIYDKAKQIKAKGWAVDMVTLNDALKRSGDLDLIGGQAYLAKLIDDVPRFTNVKDYCRIVLEHAVERSIITHSQQAQNRIFDRDCDALEVMSDFEQTLLELRARLQPRGKYIWVGDAVNLAIDALNKQIDGEAPAKFPTGFHAIDKALGGGIGKKKTCLIGARTSQGKSTIALQFALNGIRAKKVKVDDEEKWVAPDLVGALFTLEMDKEEIGHRVIHTDTGIADDVYKRVSFDDNEIGFIHSTRDAFAESKLAIYDNPMLSPASLLTDCKELFRQQKRLDYVVVDYLALMVPNEKRQLENRTREIGAISRGLKLAAMILDCPIISPAQLKREAEHRDSSLRLSDLRDSGDLEQDTDIVFLLQPGDQTDFKLKYKIDAAKVRGGRKFTTSLDFDVRCGRFLLDYYNAKDYQSPSTYTDDAPEERNY